ncbi:MAG TPA: pilus assembly protein [Hyphomicrobiales bacterium]|nr:pilus assembly protein [Rhodobiaceae bacterium]HXK53227.1 pilus assembly protein [Hyphomicrobiales bacterium]
MTTIANATRKPGPAPTTRRGKPGNILTRFAAAKGGVTAVEFAFVAVPFFSLLFGIIEVAMVFFAGQLVESSVSEAARLIRTGQAQSQGFDEARFKAEICDKIGVFSNCENTLKLDVRTYQDFKTASENLANPIDADGNLIENFDYQPGVGGDIVLVRAFYEWKTVTPGFSVTPGNLANGNTLLASTVAFRNEPF